MVDFFELELYGLWVHGCHPVGDCVADVEGLGFGLAGEMDEETVGISIDDMGTPRFVLVDHLDGLLKVSSILVPIWDSERTFSRVSLPVCTIQSAISTHGIRPENVADV